MPNTRSGTQATTEKTDSLEKAEAAKEKQSGPSATEGMVGGDELDKAIGDKGGKGVNPEVTSAEDDPLEEAEATKEK
ncbi:uncharacterized protein HMPREF1541_02559 [Cyphellophora europaea CBS 101466]|uniref:Uncharacterized protein n=1 Tax=Cyphellophora europaea (strain CBS 101466) TaxID=1220924 RepID=W2S495_CYPE1|nr:uncharacterized protein HMPREF1541_02559 [Cyphellophora europaea CBS 101466]ETN43400.1 hypothetical protein HMPREF1541_02559 [Cyphellophora europaea CBS 101466]